MEGLIAATEAEAEAFGAHVGTPVDIEMHIARLAAGLLNRMAMGGDPRGLPILAWLSRVPRKPKVLDLLPMPAWLRDRVSTARQPPERAALREALRGLVEERMARGTTARATCSGASRTPPTGRPGRGCRSTRCATRPPA